MRKNLLWAGLLCCFAAFAQSTSDNAAAEALKQRLKDLDILKAPPRPVLQKAPTALAPKACSIPLQNTIPQAPQARVRIVPQIRPALPVPEKFPQISPVPALPPNPLPQVTPAPAIPPTRAEAGVIQPSMKPIPGDVIDYPAPPCEPR